MLSCNGDLRDFVVADGSALDSNRAAFFGGENQYVPPALDGWRNCSRWHRQQLPSLRYARVAWHKMASSRGLGTTYICNFPPNPSSLYNTVHPPTCTGALRVAGSMQGLQVRGGSRAVNNAVTGRGGLLWCGGAASDVVVAAASNLSRNSATREGGGLYVGGRLARVSVSGVARVEDNSAGKLGGRCAAAGQVVHRLVACKCGIVH